MQSMIICDVGGTNGRFAVADFSNSNMAPEINKIHIFPCKDFITFSDMLEAYIKILKDPIPKAASFAIAGDISPRQGNLWHYNWNIFASEIEKQFGFDHVTLLNDYEALAYAIPYFSDQDLLNITDCRTPLKDAPMSIFGIGTGLGGAIAVPVKDGIKSLSAEPGHLSFAPKTKLERELSIYLYQSIHHVSNEVILSGGGIKHIYEFLGGAQLTAAEITDAARMGDDDIAVKTIKMFFAILASVAGDMALAQGAKGGVYIGGGIIAKIADLIDKQDFIERFDDKGPMRSYVQTIPIKFITAQTPALLGAAMGFNK